MEWKEGDRRGERRGGRCVVQNLHRLLESGIRVRRWYVKFEILKSVKK